MKMTDLIARGYPQGILDIWEHEGSKDLLPVQIKAIQEFGILDKNEGNLLIIAPTSSGKTFLGELAAVKEALDMRRTLFLVPYRAMAEELYASFKAKYSSFGLRIAISDRDHREYDEEILGGRFQIAVLVYEKLAGLLIQEHKLLEGCGLVVADEVQMMADSTRGPIIELLLTKLLLFTEKPRILALSAVLDRLNGFDTWLKCRVLRESTRPVELREGVYTRDGQVNYREFNRKQEGQETLKPWTTIQDAVLNLVVASVERDEQALLFCNTRESTVAMARFLAQNLSPTKATLDTIRQANDLPTSSTLEELQNLLQTGVAYHNADLSLEERLLLEDGFRKRNIRILVSTSTLAMGVNIPARNVIVRDLHKWRGRREIPISVGEYKNMIGRAGRYSAGDPFGRSYLIAASPAEANAFRKNYVLGSLEGFSSSFGDHPIDSQVLEIITAELARTPDEIRQFVFSTYNGQHKWTSATSRGAIGQMITDAIDRCIQYGAAEIDQTGFLAATKPGRLCAIGGYSLEHLRSAIEYLHNYESDVDASVLFWALKTDMESDAQAYSIGRLTSSEYRSGKYQGTLRELASTTTLGPILDRLALSPESIDYDACVVLRRCLACYAFISELPTRRIEENFPGLRIGSIRNAAQVCAWLISLLAEVSILVGMNAKRRASLRRLCERLEHGAAEDALELCRIRDSGLSRDERIHLVASSIRTIDEVLGRSAEDLPISKRKALRLLKAAEATIVDNMERRMRIQRTRLEVAGVELATLKRLYEAEGRELEQVIDEVLKPPFIGLVCRRIERQNEGDPDHILHDEAGNTFAIQTTAREKKNISMKKATSVIGQSSKYRPLGYIVFGRPDFEALAVKDSEDQVSAGLNYKLIPIYVLAEMWVLFNEKRISPGDAQEVLTQWSGYISMQRLEDLLLSKGGA